jgi:hypothetical protein
MNQLAPRLRQKDIKKEMAPGLPQNIVAMGIT